MAKLAVSSPYVLDPDETVEVLGRDVEEGEEYVVRAEGGLLTQGPTKSVAGIGTVRLPGGQEKPLDVLDGGQQWYVHNPSSTESRTLHVWENNPLGIRVRWGDIEADRNRSTDQARQSAASVAEVNADQTETLSEGESQTSTIRADSGEVWELDKIYLFCSHAGATAPHKFIIRSEKEGVEIGFGRIDDNPLEYSSGQWVSAATGRDDMAGLKINDAGGMEVEYALETTSDADQTNTRKIRCTFDVVKA